MLSPSLEDYLEEIYRFNNEAENIRITNVANKLKVSLPSVTNAVQKLTEKGYLYYQPYQSIELTQKGEKLGSFLVSRNETLQEFVEIIGSTSNKEDEAEAMEHYLSKDTVAAIASLVKFLKEYPDIRKKIINFKEDFTNNIGSD